MSEDGEDNEYTFVYSEDVKLESSQGTESADQQEKVEKEPIDKAEQDEDTDEEEEERPTLDPMDEEAWQTQRFQKYCCVL